MHVSCFFSGPPGNKAKLVALHTGRPLSLVSKSCYWVQTFSRQTEGLRCIKIKDRTISGLHTKDTKITQLAFISHLLNNRRCNIKRHNRYSIFSKKWGVTRAHFLRMTCQAIEVSGPGWLWSHNLQCAHWPGVIQDIVRGVFSFLAFVNASPQGVNLRWPNTALHGSMRTLSPIITTSHWGGTRWIIVCFMANTKTTRMCTEFNEVCLWVASRFYCLANKKAQSSILGSLELGELLQNCHLGLSWLRIDRQPRLMPKTWQWVDTCLGG